MDGFIMLASVDASLEYWAVRNPNALLGEILDIMVIRRAIDKQGGVSLDAPWMQDIVCTVSDVHLVFPTESERKANRAQPVLTKGDIASTMQLNYEITDHCSVKMAKAMQNASKYNRSLWAYIFARCPGRRFVELASKSGLKGATVKQILGWAWDKLDDPADLFSSRFQPQSVYRELVKHQTKQQFLDSLPDPNTYNMDVLPKRLKLRDDKNRWRTKKAVMKDVRSLKGIGPCLSKHMWRIHNGFEPSNLPDDSAYADTGSGARSFLLVWADLPQRFGINAASQSACDTFNTHLQRLIRELEHFLIRRIAKAKLEEEKYWHTVLQSELLSCPEAVQFLCCEGIKVLRFLITRDPRFLITRHRL